MTPQFVAALAAIPFALLITIGGIRSPVRLLAFYALLVPFGSAILLPIGLPDAFRSSTSVVGALLIAATVAHLLTGRRRSARLAPAVAIWLLLLGLTVLSVLWSINSAETERSLLVLASLIALYVFATFLAVGGSDLRWLETGLAGGGAITGIIGLVELAQGTVALNGGEAGRFHISGGEGGDPNITAASLLLPLAVALTRASRADTVRTRLAFFAAAILSGTGIVLTLSRGGLIAAAVVLVVLGAHETRARVAAAYLLLPTVAAAGVLMTTHVSRVGSGSSTGRSQIWRLGLEACPRYCWAGSGWSTFRDVYEQRVLTTPWANRPGNLVRFSAHDFVLAGVIEAGFAGVVLMLAGIGSIVRDLLRIGRDVRAAALAGLLAIVVSNFFVNNFAFKYFWLGLIYASLVAGGYTRGPVPRRRGAAVVVRAR